MREPTDFSISIKTLKASFPKSCQVGTGEDFCIFDVRSDHKRLVFQQFMKLVQENYSRERYSISSSRPIQA